MLGDFYVHTGNLKHLSFRISCHRLLAQRVPATASSRAMNDDLIGSGHALECRSLMPGLATGLALAFLPFHIGTTSRPITGGRFAAVVTVGVQLLLKLLHLLRERFDHRP